MKNDLKIKALFLSTVAVSLFSLSAPVKASAPDVVGEVTTVIGVASLRQSPGDGEPLKRGAQVRAGDRIETGPGGHVHIRFIDGGMVSVRPLSSLHIHEYRNESAASKGAIKFELEQGVVRSVTGAWGEQSRERFRLNTPVAAIGIKGTDFVVRTGSAATQASVISGAIVMSPLDAACLGSLGPCNAEKSALLTADMSGKMLELGHSGVPRLVPAVDLEARLDRPAGPRQSERSATTLASEKSSVPLGGEKSAGVPGDGFEKVALNQNRAGQLVESALPDRVAAAPVTAPVPDDRPLVWMRNILEWNIPENSISRRFDSAEVASREATVGNFFMTLYRDESTRTSFSPPAAAVSFNLAESSASYSRPGIAYQPVAVSAGKLDVDFAKATYATSLGLSGAFGQTQFVSAGKIAQNGLFVDASAGQALAGAFSLDGKQAAYQFEKNVANGTVSGLTLWGR